LRFAHDFAFSAHFSASGPDCLLYIVTGEDRWELWTVQPRR
jgi:hypothetical protein